MNILQVAHITEIPGPVQFLAIFFEKKGDKVYKIYHPLAGAKIDFSEFFKDGDSVERKKATGGIAGYFFDFFKTIFWAKKIGKPIDKAIGMNCFDVLPLVVLKKKLKIKEVIFFNTDFSRRRFKNNILNWIYVLLDKFCAKKSDIVCCNTRRTIDQRIGEGVDEKKIVYTPNGVFMDEIGQVDFSAKKFEKKILFIGHISKAHGLQDIINCLGDFDLKLEIIGSGDYEIELKKIVRDRNISNKVKFLGNMSHQNVIEYLKGFSGFGIAPYSLGGSDWVYYCDPVKAKEYLACGVPVIISDVPEVAEQIDNKKIGFIYNNVDSMNMVLEKVSNLSVDEYEIMLKNIIKIRNSFDLDLIYKDIIYEK